MENKLRTIPQSLKLFAILEKLDLIEDRERLALQYSKGRTGQTSKLYVNECSELISDLQKQADNSSDKMRKKILSIAHSMGWQLEQNGRLIVDMERVNNWCVKYGYLHKRLNSYSARELVRLVSQFEEMYHSNIGIKNGNQPSKTDQ